MFQVRTTNPLYSSKQYFYVKEDAEEYIKKIIDISLKFFKKLNARERKKYDFGKLQKLHQHVYLTEFNHKNSHVSKCFGKAVQEKPPITYEEFMTVWQKENKKRHNAIGTTKMSKSAGK